MTLTLSAPALPRHRANPRPHTWTFQVEGLPGRLRMDVEKLMLLLPPGEPGDEWFTRWRKYPDGYACRETIRATGAEIGAFAEALDEFARREQVMAQLTRRPYHGAHG